MDRVPRSGTRIVYEDRSVTFRHQDRMRIGVSRSDTRIEYEERSVTYRHERNKDNEILKDVNILNLMNLIPK